jgi:hypothetical protein
MSLFLTTPVFAETIILKSGKTVEGKIIEKTDKYIKMDMEGVAITYFIIEIEKIGGEQLTSPQSSNIQETKSMQADIQSNIAQNITNSNPIQYRDIPEEANNYDKELLGYGIRFIPPPGWQKLKLVDRPEGIFFHSLDKNAVISLTFGIPASTASYNISMYLFRVNKKPTSEKKIEFLNAPCYVFINLEKNKKGMMIKHLTYHLFKNGKYFHIFYSADEKWFNNYLSEFEESLATYSLIEE